MVQLCLDLLPPTLWTNGHKHENIPHPFFLIQPSKAGTSSVLCREVRHGKMKHFVSHLSCLGCSSGSILVPKSNLHSGFHPSDSDYILVVLILLSPRPHTHSLICIYSGSGLASIFGASNAMDSGNSSLTYTAPKQPKKQAKGEKSNLLR